MNCNTIGTPDAPRRPAPQRLFEDDKEVLVAAAASASDDNYSYYYYYYYYDADDDDNDDNDVTFAQIGLVAPLVAVDVDVVILSSFKSCFKYISIIIG